MIELKHFRKQFREKVILNDIQVCFEEAKIVGIVGESGAGKTTLLNLISLLDQDFEGERIISSIDTRHLSKKKREKLRLDTFSYVFSDANLLTYLSVRENIILPLQLQKKAIDEVRLNDISQIMKISSLLDRKDVNTLSEGEKQRVSICRALMNQTPFLVCDEPTAHLNHELSQEILHLLSHISHTMNRGVIVSTHDESLLSSFDVVYQIRDTKLYECKK